MFKNYFTVALRNLRKNAGYSFINIVGLATGMAVALLIGLWIWSELTYNQSFKNYSRIAQVWQHNLINGAKESWIAVPPVLAEEIRNKFGSDFKYVLQASWNSGHVLMAGEKKFDKTGTYIEPQVIEMLGLKMLRGTREALKDPYSIILSESTAKAYFEGDDPMGKTLRIDNKLDVKVTGVYEDLPRNSSFNDVYYFMPWELNLIANERIRKMENPWGSNFTQVLAQIADNADMDRVSAKIVNVKYDKVKNGFDERYKSEVFLHPMSKWHLYPDFNNGVNTASGMQFVWLFGIIGIFVLLLACINFMNLSTARSEKRAKEVGIRKSIGSSRYQLIGQFFSESMLVSLLAFMISLLFVQLSLPFFNQVADKQLSLPYADPLFWLIGIGFSLATGIVAGSYPALFLSSFRPVKVLKGTFRAGRLASIPRQALVVLQFTVSVTLIIGTIIVFQQIQYAKNRPIGYDRNGLINMYEHTRDIHNHFEAVRTELKNSEAIVEMTESGSPTTDVWGANGGFDWKGKDPTLGVNFPNNGTTYEYGKTVGWTFKEGRDFSRDHATDSMAFVINETAAKFFGFKNTVGEELIWNGERYTIIGVINDMVIQSPYQTIQPQLFHIERRGSGNLFILKLNPLRSSTASLDKIREVFTKYDPSSPFDYQFVDQDYARKFESEERIGKLASTFAGLAIFISCLGIFGLASFVAEQRTKEIGVRKVLGASVLNLWGMLSKDFVMLVIVSLFVAIPSAYYFMNTWLTRYEYRTEMAWWIFAAAGAGALVITLCTVSFQSIKAALVNPVNSLRAE
ncbi:MAG TPA: ABC transporter permease [Cyclobacteriaceae bacterium]|nr:ABC transporter permease [Cyclobacteriaceae bacterium]